MSPTRTSDLWKVRVGARSRRGRRKRSAEPARALEAIDDGLRDLVARQFPDLWDDLSLVGQELFVRGLMEAALRPPEDRSQAIADVMETWYEAHRMLYVPVDDEPYTPEERAAVDAALERLAQGKGVPLDDLLSEAEL